MQDLVWNDRNFMEAFTANYGYPNADLAAIYGVPAPAKEFDRVEFPAASERAGLLGQVLFLTLAAKPDESSPTARGLFVRQQFLCQEVPPPPANVNTNLPPVTEAKPQTNRDRMIQHVSDATCHTCHNLIDSIGFGLEKFDAIGQRRETFSLSFAPAGPGRRGAKPTVVQLPLDTDGVVAGIPDSKFSSPRGLGTVLAKTPQCQECMVKKYFRYTAGRMETPADEPVIHQALVDFQKSGFHFKELMTSLIRARELQDEKDSDHLASNREVR